MDQTLVNGLANPVNSVQQGYQGVTTQLRAAQDLHDNQMLKVFEFAGDGQVDAAKAYAQAHGIQIPPEVLGNADLAQGLAIAGKIYGKDPHAAHAFTVAWMQNQGLPVEQRTLTSAKQAGAPIDPEDRKFRGMIAMLDFKSRLPNGGQRSTFNPNQSRFNAGQKAADTAMMSTIDPSQQATKADAARQTAYKEWDANFKNASPGLMGDASDSPDSPDDINEYGATIKQMPQDDIGGSQPAPAAAPPAAPQTPTQSLASPSQIPSGLPQGSSQIGTSGGKPVYKAPNGDMFIDNGTP